LARTGGGILWRPPSRTACLITVLQFVSLETTMKKMHIQAKYNSYSINVGPNILKF